MNSSGQRLALVRPVLVVDDALVRAALAEAVRRAATGEATLWSAGTRRLVEQAVDRADAAADVRARLAARTDRERDVIVTCDLLLHQSGRHAA